MIIKFSSIIAAALAAIAGNVIAAPGPRALEQVDLFERDLDLYPRLFKADAPHKEQHHAVAYRLIEAVTASVNADVDARHAAHALRQANKHAEAAEWSMLAAAHRGWVKTHSNKHDQHARAAEASDPSDLLHNVREDRKEARKITADAERTSRDAKDVIRQHRKVRH